ncbi:MAG TPA: UDP-N-acetylmuramoyl-L-alanine--D-glutamate ligase, partial [Thermoanaerobaculia bacterium]|nr:UDP-N-acetylmuramoyl-L-alanine--D-glutamate ligase [Thermoanaerobaculia bacterium]
MNDATSTATRSTARPDLGAGRSWRRVLVYGFGLSGRAAAALLLGRGAAVLAVDGRRREALDLEGLPSGSLETWEESSHAARAGELPADVEAVVLSPGVPPDRPLLAAARRRGLPVISELELAFPLVDGPVVAITGSNGKSTTTALAGAMIAAGGRPVEVCGNIGTPLSAVVGAGAGERVFVVEVSSFQLEAVETFRPRAGALLNLSPDHLDRYDSFDAYVAAKERLFERQQADDVAVLNADDPRAAAAPTRARRRLFSRRGAVADGCWLAGDAVVETGPGGEATLFARAELPLAGAHNLENAMAAALLARAVGTPVEAVRRSLVGFQGLPHRMQRVAESGGVTWYDDSKATNVAATAKSLADLPDGTVHLILGGKAKGDDPAELRELVRAKAKRVYLVGAAAELFARGLAGAAPQERADTIERAVGGGG